MSKPNWDEAPEGATHWERESDGATAGWMRNDGGEWFFLSSKGIWLKHIISNVSGDRLANMIKRPSQAWTGEGLPPVGALVDAPINGARYMCELLAIDGDECAVRMPGAIRVVNLAELRAIRTPEQIAAEERERAINEMVGVWKRTMGRFAEEERGLAEMLYDAGYRKP